MSSSSRAGIYVHFAYCAHRCVYCDFALATPKHIPAERYTDALLAELAASAPTLGGPARTLYIGGGTPSLWPTPELARFLAAVRANPGLVPDAELTLEANPEDVTDEWLAAILDLGVNRLSLGVQSLDERQLTHLSRAHGVAGATAALTRIASTYRAPASALRSYSVDLMYGLPGQTLGTFVSEVDRLVSDYAPPHLSLYALTIEPHTVLGLATRRGAAERPDDALQADMMFAARDLLAARGYTHYEVSSFARPGHIAVHNSAYWELRPWLGLGAGAHAFAAGRRSKNEARPSRYIERALATGEAVVESEVPDAGTLAFEHILTGLRRLDVGVTLAADHHARFASAIAAEVAAGRVTLSGDVLRLTDHGLRFMDDVLLAFVP